MTLTLDFQGQIFNSHILGMGRSIDLEWKRCMEGHSHQIRKAYTLEL